MKLIIYIFLFSCLYIQSSQSQTLELRCDDYFAYQNDTIDVPIIVSGFTNLISFQASIQFDTTIIELIDINEYAAPLSPSNVTNNSGLIRVVWFDLNTGATLSTGDTLCVLRMLVIGNLGQVSPIEFVNQPLNIEAVNSNFSILNTNLIQGSVTVLGSLLPVQLDQFQVKRLNANQVDLYWKTSKETKNDRYEIERLLEHEKEPQTIAHIQGEIFAMKYHYVDDNSYSENSYYRLKHIDQNQIITYFDWHSIKGENFSDNLSIYYANNSINIKTDEWEIQCAQFSIQSYNGELIYQQKIKLIAHQLLSLSINELIENQIYVICLILPNGVQKTKKILFMQ